MPETKPDWSQAKPFKRWLHQQVRFRGMTYGDLAKRAGLNRGSVSNILSGRRRPKAQTCTKIAGALNIPPEIVLRQVGHLPPATDKPADFTEMKEIMQQLSAAERADLLQYALFRLTDQLVDDEAESD